MKAASNDLLLEDPDLPLPPSDEERVAYTKPDAIGLGISSLLLCVAFGGGSYYFCLNKPAWVIPYAIFSVLVCLGLLSSGILYSRLSRC